MDRYGTVMIGRLRDPADAPRVEAMSALIREWIEERRVPGFLHQDLMVSEDGATVVAATYFDSKANYDALADDPEQDRWYTERLAPMLDGEPQWLDGYWTDSFDGVG